MDIDCGNVFADEEGTFWICSINERLKEILEFGRCGGLRVRGLGLEQAIKGRNQVTVDVVGPKASVGALFGRAWIQRGVRRNVFKLSWDVY